jgi:hypothetical protein
MIYEFTALVASICLLVVYLKTRVPRLTVLDSFMFCFFLQYGPHTLFITGFNVFAPEMGEAADSQFLLGMTLAYLSLACALMLAASVGRTAANSAVTSTDGPHRVVPPLMLAGVYVVFFALIQGDGAHITREYVAGFLGTSSFSYTEIRREIFDESLYVRIASVTRHTTTALLFAWLLFLLKPLRVQSLAVGGAALAVFVVCGMQMNKFPFVYFLTLAAVCVLSGRGASLNRGRGLLMLVLLVGAAVPLLYGLYLVQYRDAATLGGGRLLELLVYRIFFCASDTLRLWFDFFPSQENFLGLGGLGSLSEMLALPSLNPTEIVPQAYVPYVDTTMQTGFIGSGYAVGGLAGVVIYAAAVGGLVGWLCRLQLADRGRKDLAPFWSVLFVNMFFLTTRELHTALLSGGTLSVLLLLLLWRRFVARLTPPPPAQTGALID